MGTVTSVRDRRPRYLILAVIPVIAVIAAVATFAFSSSSTSTAKPSGAATGNSVTILNFSFSPSPLTVAPGAHVTVSNRDGTTHTLSASASGGFDTGDINGGSTTTFVAPTKPGTYHYQCNIHQYMHGVMTVAP
jgi:plastocyanin